MPHDKLPALRVFVAMPGTDLGPHAIWKQPADVRSFYGKVGVALEERLQRPVELIVEREKTEAGVIHRSMFDEALRADVFLADLTGHNPNVFLELGVRYALRRHVTIPVSQHTTRLPFNIEHVRAVEYANRPDHIAIEKIVDLVVSGLESRHNDSPVLDVLDVEIVDRGLWEKVSGARSAALLRAAEREEGTQERLRLLSEAVESAPRAVDARLRLATELRKAGSYTEAISVLDEGLRLDPTRAVFLQEKGLALGKLGDDHLGEAVDSLRDAVRIEPENASFLSNLGGALRRLALRDAPDRYEEPLLREALDCYLTSCRAEPYDTYPALNVVRLQLLLCRSDAGQGDAARDRLRRLQHLCAFEVAENPDDYWRAFDLADVLLLLSRPDEGLAEYGRGIGLVSGPQRPSELKSPLRALVELQEAGVLEPAVQQGLQDAIDLLEASRRAALDSTGDGGAS